MASTVMDVVAAGGMSRAVEAAGQGFTDQLLTSCSRDHPPNNELVGADFSTAVSTACSDAHQLGGGSDDRKKFLDDTGRDRP